MGLSIFSKWELGMVVFTFFRLGLDPAGTFPLDLLQ